MSTLLIEGGKRLSGTVSVEGNKNAALPLLAACLLTREMVHASQRPSYSGRGSDGAAAGPSWRGGRGIGDDDASGALCPAWSRTSQTVFSSASSAGRCSCWGPLLACRGRARLAPPGGDFPARRTIATHLDALAAMGARVLEGPEHHLEAPDGLKPASMYLYEASVTGTETALLAAAALQARPRSVTRPASRMSASSASFSEARRRRHRCRHDHNSSRGRGATARRRARLSGDYIEAGSWAVVPAVRGGASRSRHEARGLEVIAAVLMRLGVHCSMTGDCFPVSNSQSRMRPFA